MRVLLRGGCSFLFAASILIVGTASRADELLVMPYACSVSGGAPVLIPSADKGYRIIGGREQRNFTACSPSDPTECRNWTVHRFDVDCSGARVPWTSVVAAADGHRRAWVEGGRLLVRMPWTWSLPQGDPCARLSEFDQRRPRYRWLARRCEFRKARAPASIVTLPYGFAPKLGIDAIFVAGGAPAHTPSVSAADPAATASRAAAENVRIETPPVPPRISPSQRRAATESRNSAAGVSPQTKARQASPPAEAKAAPVATGSPASRAIINRRASEPGNTLPKALPATEHPEISTVVAADIATKSDSVQTAAIVQPPSKENSKASQIGQPQNEAEIRGQVRGLVSYLSDPTTVAVATLSVLATMLFAGFALMRQSDASRARLATSRDIGSVWLEENGSREQPSMALVKRDEASAPSSQQRPPAPQPVPARIPDLASNWGDTIPQTRVDALRVLGIGVSSDANQTAIKKVVDGLRMSWHPDHADGEDDRRVRELRLKQINAAWELISGARAEAHA